MPDSPRDLLVLHFSRLPDPRRQGSVKHLLNEILVSATVAMLCGAEGSKSIALFVETRLDWLRTFLRLENGAPSHETYRRVFSLLDSEELEIAFMTWVADVSEGEPPRLLALDGKTLKGSSSAAKNLKALHMVSAYAVEEGLILGQARVPDKTNEITAFKKILAWLELEGTIVTLDAMGCQKESAAQIVDKKGDYVLSLKDNQPTLRQSVEDLFEAHDLGTGGLEHDEFESSEKSHGRRVVRRVTTLRVEGKDIEGSAGWKGLTTIGRIITDRWEGDKHSQGRRFFITSLDNDAKELGWAVRNHWRVENELHWVLDVAFREDLRKVVDRRAAENLGVLRRITTQLLKSNKTVKAGINNKRKVAAWNPPYALKVLGIVAA